MCHQCGVGGLNSSNNIEVAVEDIPFYFIYFIYLFLFSDIWIRT